MKPPARVAVAVIVASLGAAACSTDSPIEIVAAPQADLLASGVGVVSEGCSLVATIGSGVVLERPGQVVTVAHTIKGATHITVIDNNGNEHPATVRAFDKDADLAVLDVPALTAPALMVGPVELGAGGVLTWGRDEGVEYLPATVTKRLLITIEDIYIDDIVERSGLELAAAIEIGDSGGAVVAPSGTVIGIVYANSRGRSDIGFATDVSEITSVLATVDGTDVDNGRCG